MYQITIPIQVLVHPGKTMIYTSKRMIRQLITLITLHNNRDLSKIQNNIQII